MLDGVTEMVAVRSGEVAHGGGGGGGGTGFLWQPATTKRVEMATRDVRCLRYVLTFFSFLHCLVLRG